MTQRIALVTGASRGIGQAIAKRLANEGYLVIGTATSEKGAAAVNDYLQELGGAGRVLNVQDAEQINQLFDSIEKEFGNVQVLVNNAGITQDGLLMRMDDNAWERVLDVNLTSVFRTSKRAIKGMMKARQGRIINITSVVAAMGNAGQTNYTASKAGIEGFTRSLAREIGSRQITVNCVAPGFIDTDMTSELDEALIQSMLNAVPLARLGKPEDIAAAVNFLASEEAGYITGTVLDVNGGMYM
ncbi:3-oxoacyl-ACP reductase FabG [Moraxella osloensis]|jgi:3-oxoacyl-[acyl-carrier protein] reductase|uniref:3-oxoacyl-[acyl-carrier-protein] reductase n=2 Tax=Pseudomonadota TaxID=1224 RepID=A0AAD0F6J0_FAUOS|nr:MULTISPECIES: 3-oxoacyl-ACP reductase FabG [Pseudomonadota]EEV23424.1 3-oxoacyl-[acyl-carrier-protein] reductase [Enhydrobacter aerosaccus SK60]GGM03026.1 beta-ketoacyl-ACP reductase [Streptomyces cinereus]ATW70541.1 3-oxoacyl-ACP reductase FabG [Moraxella osloensis]ATY49242.1 3-oxoacyl-ACP reductase FabG [Moraxella osloensis]KND22278.1 3-ketoacyl-ACP reductase [Enhydrobacter aerosaccus]